MRAYTSAEQRYFAALGGFIAFWASTEISLDRTVEHIIRLWPDCPEKKLPRGLSKKLGIFRQYVSAADFNLTDADAIAEFRKHCHIAIDNLCEVGEARHWAAHGYALMSIVAKHDADTLTFVRSVRDKPGQSTKRSYTIAQLDALAARSWALTKWLFAFASIGLEVIPEEKLYQLFPTLRGKVAAIRPIRKG